MYDSFNTKTRNAAQELHASAALAAIRPTLLRQDALRKVYNNLPVALRQRSYISGSQYCNEVYVSVYVRDLDSFKDKTLTNVLDKFIDWECDTNDYTYGAPNRDFRFAKEFAWVHDTRSIAYKKLVKLDKLPDTYRISVGVYAYVKEDSPLCRVVVKGFEEKVVRTEIKEIVCA